MHVWELGFSEPCAGDRSQEHTTPINLRLSLHSGPSPLTPPGEATDLFPEAWACPGSLRNSTLGASGRGSTLGSCSSKVSEGGHGSARGGLDGTWFVF